MQISNVTAMPVPTNTAPCAADDLYDRLLRLKPEGLSERAWTINAGVSSSFFEKIKAGEQPSEADVPKILGVIGVTQAEFEAEGRPVLRQPDKAPAERKNDAKPQGSSEAGRIAPTVEGHPVDAAKAPERSAPKEHAPDELSRATAEAISRWREAERQVAAAGLAGAGEHRARLVTDIARLALEIECRQQATRGR
ncbi:hypothetical protein [Sphingosinicella sp. BN140058]|uniref:hypothetical protein n=1 Tax=Sphingosinicella sp. BN140058 TaxID=1892855 RepID=UPI0010134899|nr:hypothetical protein [Sphingosinicella sp. BN140058]QAY75189.1 hypothetical protein ETR14_00565 [Sphingosinicella sp. BN140058]